MNPQTVKSSNTTCASPLIVASNEQACDRQECLRRNVIECDPEFRVVVSPRGRAEQLGAMCRHQPDDVAATSKDASGRQSNFDLDDGSGFDAGVRYDAQATQADIRAARKRCDGFSVFGGQLQACVERDALAALSGLSRFSSHSVHTLVLAILLNVSA